ncbi:nucleoside deaminase [Hydrogenivirga sp.]
MREVFLREALIEAEKAHSHGEVPVGCVVVKNGEVIARAHNLTESMKDASAHAEMLALKEAADRLGDWRLNGCEVYVTLEPCVMCTYALVLFRVERVVFGALDEKHGGVLSLYSILDDERLNHRVRWVYEPHEDCGRLLREFFKGRRW